MAFCYYRSCGKYFCGGAIALQLDESQVDANGKKMADAPRVKENRYKYMAGAEMVKILRLLY